MSDQSGKPYRQGSSDSMRGADTPTRLRKQYDVNSPKLRKADLSRLGKTGQQPPNNKSAYDTNHNQNTAAGAGQGGGYDPSVPSFVTQVARPGANTNNHQHTAKPPPDTSQQFSSNLQDANEQNGCCWSCFPICGMRGRGRPSTEIKKANQSTTEGMVNLDTLPPRNAQNDDCEHYSETDSGFASKSSEAEHGRGDGHLAGQGRNGTPEDDPSSERSGTPGPEIPGLLGKKPSASKGKKCLVLDLDETLVHSSFKPVQDADFVVPVEIDGVVYKVYVLKRPFVDEFLIECAKYYEMVVFTASLSKYANPLLDMLDTHNVIQHRLFRESCVLHGQAYVKDLSKLGRRMEDIIFVDNSPLSYAFQPTSAIPIQSWFDDRTDTQLRDLLPVLQTTLRDERDVRDILDANNKSFEWLCAQGKKSINSSI